MEFEHSAFEHVTPYIIPITEAIEIRLVQVLAPQNSEIRCSKKNIRIVPRPLTSYRFYIWPRVLIDTRYFVIELLTEQRVSRNNDAKPNRLNGRNVVSGYGYG